MAGRFSKVKVKSFKWETTTESDIHDGIYRVGKPAPFFDSREITRIVCLQGYPNGERFDFYLGKDTTVTISMVLSGAGKLTVERLKGVAG